MARWQPDPRGRLLRAALDLFAEQGYDATTTAQLAERAGLTKATVFRLFADKREILFQGQDASVRLVHATVAGAPGHLDPLGLVRAALRALCDTHVPEQREIGRRVEALLEASGELRERAAFKRSSITAALQEALVERGEESAVAGALADLAVRAYYDGFSVWALADDEASLADIALGRLDTLVDSLRTALGASADSLVGGPGA